MDSSSKLFLKLSSLKNDVDMMHMCLDQEAERDLFRRKLDTTKISLNELNTHLTNIKGN